MKKQDKELDDITQQIEMFMSLWHGGERDSAANHLAQMIFDMKRKAVVHQQRLNVVFVVLLFVLHWIFMTSFFDTELGRRIIVQFYIWGN